MDEPLDSSPFEIPTIALVGWRLKFWMYLDEPPFIGDCVSIFKCENEDYYRLGINFDKDTDVVGIKLDSIEAVTRLKRITKTYDVISLVDMQKKKETSTDS